jgi:membrane protein
VQHQIKGMSQTYGFFAIVLGLLAWIFLLARVFLYAAEVNVVRKERLWPRALAPPPLTEADHRAYEKYAETEERRPGEDVRVTHSA